MHPLFAGLAIGLIQHQRYEQLLHMLMLLCTLHSGKARAALLVFDMTIGQSWESYSQKGTCTLCQGIHGGERADSLQFVVPGAVRSADSYCPGADHAAAC